MKQLYPKLKQLLIVCIFCTRSIVSYDQDLPGAGMNLQTAPAGTLVIAMDHTNQATSSINAATGTYLFNLKAYGLVTLFRNTGANVNWVIRSGKAKDGIDFSASAERIFPSYAAAQMLDFRSGPFLIFPSDTIGAEYTIQWFNYSLPDSCKVKVYRLTQDVDVDIRYTLTNPPRVALLHDSCDIHRNYLEMASTPTVNYDCLPNASGLITGCYSMVTIPHMVASDLTNYDADSVYNFVMAGGSMLAQCESMETFENRGRYQSSNGIFVDPTGGQYNNFNNNVNYDNPDMAYGQILGTVKPWLRGAQKVWRYNSATTNNFYPVVSCRRNGADNLYYMASVSKMTSDLGSLVFYLGNHEYRSNDCHTCLSTDLINEQEINGMRLYLNAVQIPTKLFPCTVLDIKVEEFTAVKKDDETVLISWSTAGSANRDHFIVEHSIDGKNFSAIGRVNSTADNSSEYKFLHHDPSLGTNYYRLRSIDNNFRAEYSSVRKVKFDDPKSTTLEVFPNPVKEGGVLSINVNDRDWLVVRLIDCTGRVVKHQSLNGNNGVAELKLGGVKSGLYVIVATTKDGLQIKNKLVIN